MMIIDNDGHLIFNFRGHQLARSMQESNPEFVAQLRSQMGNNAANATTRL